MDYRGFFCSLFAPVPFLVVWVVSAHYIILSRAHAEMLAIHLSIFPMSAVVVNQTNVIFQNATFGGKELYPVVLIQTEKKLFANLMIQNWTQLSIIILFQRPQLILVTIFCQY